MKVLISGYYGSHNLGDEAILRSIIAGLRQRWPESEITVLSSSPAATNKLHSVEAVSHSNPLAILSAVSKTDLLISGGGTLFQDVTSRRSFIYYIGIILLAKLFRKKTVVFAQGFGPLRSPANILLARWVLGRVDLITLRDEASYHALKALGIVRPPQFVTADPVPLLEWDEAANAERIFRQNMIDPSRPVVAISVRELPAQRSDEEKLIAILAQAIDRLVQEKGYQPVFLLLHRKDARISSKVAEAMSERSVILSRLEDPAEMVAIISKCDLLVGMRLHALVFAAMSATPMLGISYDPKVSAFMASIRQPALDLSETIAPGGIEREINTLLDKGEIVHTVLQIAKDHLYHKAELNFTLLGAYIMDRDKVVKFAGVQIDNVSMKEALSRVKKLWESSSPSLIVTPNPEMIVTSQEDRELGSIINGAALRVPDGISLVVVSRLLGHPLKERVSGIDLMLQMARAAGDECKKIYLLGGAAGVAEEAALKLKQQFPGLSIAGVHDGYFSEGDDYTMIDMIKRSGADILFVGLGAGRQEKWLNRHLSELGVKIGMCVGGSFDVISGRKKRAPVWAQKLYIEWLYRLFSEPQRWKRQLALPKFLWLMFFGR